MNLRKKTSHIFICNCTCIWCDNILYFFHYHHFHSFVFYKVIYIEKFLPIAILKMAATIPHKFNIVRFQRHFICVEIFRCRESIQDIIIYPHMKCRSNRTMLNLFGIVVAILKMVTGRNFSMSGIISWHHNLPTYEMSVWLFFSCLKSKHFFFLIMFLIYSCSHV
jgi:hypothetical protein